jgi:hypothetical protein
MIDTFALALTHGLIFITVWRIVFKPGLDGEDEGEAPGA